MGFRKHLGFAFAVVLGAGMFGAGVLAGPYDHPEPKTPPPGPPPAAAAAPENPQDPMHQCQLGCVDSCKAFANPGLRDQCLASCNAKCSATYEP
jgi:hypothetical protein